MQWAYNISGTKTHVRYFPIGEAMANAGVCVEEPADATNGVALVEVATAADSLGLTIDAQPTYNTAQQSDNSDPAAYVGVIINPDAVLQVRLSGDGTTGTALTAYFNTIASTTGLIVTPSATSGGSAFDTTTFDDCTVFCYEGANAGIYRQIDVGDATNCDVVVAFPHDIAVDDKFLFIPFKAGGNHYVELTSDLLEADVSGGEDTDNKNYRPVSLVLNDVGNNGLLNCYVNVVAYDHAFSGSALA